MSRPEDRARAGKVARAAVRRSSHADWSPSKKRRDAVELIEHQNTDRLDWLVPIRRGRMMVSAFTFFRGAAKVMAADLAATPRSGLTVQLCGDAHLSNFGVYASPERNLVFDLNDFDETIAGPWEWDVKRLAASVMIAAQYREFDDETCRSMTADSVQEYRNAMRQLAGMRTLDAWYGVPTPYFQRRIDEVSNDKRARKTLDRFAAKARSRDNLQALSKLAANVDGRYQIRSDPPLLLPVRELPPEAEPDELEAIVLESFTSYKESLGRERRHVLDRFRPTDVALKVVGVGSVGTRCLVLLLEGRDSNDPLFLQFKEATRSVLEEHLSPSPHDNQGERVVEGQRLMQTTSDIFLGWTRADDQRDFYGRQLRDWKGSVNIDVGEPIDGHRYARLCGWTLARAHARSGDAIAIAAYLGTSDTFDRAVSAFAETYATQNQADFDAFTGAIASGKLVAEVGR